MRNSVNRGVVRSSKKNFRDVLLDHIGINFRTGDVFDVVYVPFERSTEAAISR